MKRLEDDVLGGDEAIESLGSAASTLTLAAWEEEAEEVGLGIWDGPPVEAELTGTLLLWEREGVCC